jgi:hypothetical protein
VRRQFHEGVETVTLAKTLLLVDVPTRTLRSRLSTSVEYSSLPHFHAPRSLRRRFGSLVARRRRREYVK